MARATRYSSDSLPSPSPNAPRSAPACSAREPLDGTEERSCQLMKRGIRKLCLGLDSTGSEDDGAGGGFLQIAQEGRLSSPGAAE